MALIGIGKEEFTEFKNNMLNQIEDLKENIEYKVSDSEIHIKEIEKNVEQIKNNIESQESEILEYKDTLKNISNKATNTNESIKGILNELVQLKDDLNNKIDNIKEKEEEILEIREQINNSNEEVSNKINSINKSLEIAKNLPNDVQNIEELILTAQALYNEIESLKNHSADKKSDIDKLYNEIYGQDIENENGETEHTDGTKDKLKKAYDDLDENINNLNELLNEAITENKNDFEKLIKKSSEKFNNVKNKLDSLLPGAMAAGLSSAYEEKTKAEKESQKQLSKNFILSIWLLIFVALLPVGIDAYRLIWTESNLIKVIQDTPNLIFAIFPLYFPIVWFAYSSNKKLNLSKRLIEEYTHKAVLGKTFEGLSTQIESLSCNESVRDELRTKLLFNLLQVSSENPGKLITDYQTSDHPLMEALDNSYKLSDSIEKLNNIPGFSTIAKQLSKKNKKQLQETENKVEDGFMQANIGNENND